MRQLITGLTVAAALLAAACTNTEPQQVAYPGRPLPPVAGATFLDPGLSAGSTDSVTNGSVSNVASGSTATEHRFPW